MTRARRRGGDDAPEADGEQKREQERERDADATEEAFEEDAEVAVENDEEDEEEYEEIEEEVEVDYTMADYAEDAIQSLGTWSDVAAWGKDTSSPSPSSSPSSSSSTGAGRGVGYATSSWATDAVRPISAGTRARPLIIPVFAACSTFTQDFTAEIAYT